MRTPAGKECKYYFGDFHRGRNVQACRLIEENPDSPPWRPSLCQSCPVPDILRANGSSALKLEATVVKKFLGFKQEVEVSGWCSECFSEVPNPLLGCPNCSRAHHPSILDLDEGPQ
ncbi:MAG: hypothetical protein HYR94_27710 [Chloroflexi bacterium]|nr:hypothetical protein [Chloroflexota bacterium]